VRQIDQLKGLVDAGIALSSELSLDGLLQRLVEAAAELTGARYAALGVIDRDGTGLERFVFTGIDPGAPAEIGELPRGRGILGVLIEDARPLRLEQLTQDPRAVGFPPGHPPMETFLGVPVGLRGRVYGNLYLTEKQGAAFSSADEELVTTLASQAAVAIENARLYEAATRWAAQLEALNEVSNALAAEIELPRLLSLITQRLLELISARLVIIVLPTAEGTLRVEAAAGDSEGVLGLVLPSDGSKSGRVLKRRRAERVDVIAEDSEVDPMTREQIGAISALYVPLVVGPRAIGVLAVHDRTGSDPRFRDEDLRIAEMFAEHAAIAVDLSARVASDAFRRIVDAQELERRRLARELHDQTGQELTSILLGLRTIEDARDEDERRQALAAARDRVVETLHDVRRLAVELRPKALDDFGLVPALERLSSTFAENTGMRVDFEPRLSGRLPPETETALYRIVQEALTNIVKHAQAHAVSIVLAQGATTVTAVIEDDGLGFSPGTETEGLGLLGMRERLTLIGGALKIESGSRKGTTIVAEVPAR